MNIEPYIKGMGAGVADRLRVVVVDDDPQQLKALRRILRRRREFVDAALFNNGLSAIEDAELSKPQLIVMDVFMPDLDGVEACRLLKANPVTESARVILTSGRVTPDLRAAGLAAGASDVIEKPFDLAKLLALVTAPNEFPRGSQVVEVLDGAATPTEASLRSEVSGDPRVRRRTTVPPRRAADVLVEILGAHGVEVVFGLPGGAISPVHDALLDAKILTVTNHHEAGAVFAAAGYAHATGRLGVGVVTSGPGALNALTGVASAWCDGLPLLLLVGEVPRRAHGRGVLQDGSAHGLKIVEIAGHITKLAAEVPDASALPHLLRRAIAIALSGRRGPVVLTLPMDVTSAMLARPRMEGHVTLSDELSRDAVVEVAQILREAKRPLVLAGSGARGGHRPLQLRRLVEQLKCPVATTPKGKGVFPESHPLSLGVLGLGGHLSSRAYLESGIDAVLVVGSSLGDLATDGFHPALQAPALIHVDIDGRQIGKSFAPTHAVVAEAGAFLDALRLELEGALPGLSEELQGGVVRHRLPPTAPGASLIAPHDALAEIQAVLPADTIYTVDSGEHFTFATHYLHLVHPDSYVVMTGLGSMGQSIGAAIGVQLGRPGRRVAAIVGDGCFAMNAFEVATAAALQLPIRVFVFNDERLGMVENGHEHVYGRRPAYATGAIDVCVIAQGLGAATLRVRKPGELVEAASLLADYPGPVVIDVQIDPEVRLPKKDRMAAFAPPPPPPPDDSRVN